MFRKIRFQILKTVRVFLDCRIFLKLCEILDCNADYFLSGTIKKSVDQNIIDMVASLSLEEQKVIWKLIDCYIHRNDNNKN